MKVIKQICVAALLTGIMAAGCDKSTPPPESEQSVPVAQAGPTTRDLLTGPRNPISLQAAPLSVRVPAGWEIKAPDNGSFVFLHGPAPHGDVEIQISPIILPPHSVPIDQAQIENLAAAAKKEMAQNPGNHLVAEVRDISGGVQLLEEVKTDSAATQPSDLNDNTTCTWRINVFVPRGSQFDQVALSVLGLTMSQYNQDGPFLRSILNSVAVDDSFTGNPNPPP